MRPLGIPTMKDRAQQALYLLALAPVVETTADKNSYGFRQVGLPNVARTYTNLHRHGPRGHIPSRGILTPSNWSRG